MTTQDGSFSWASPLGIAVALFLVYGAIYLLAGVLSGAAFAGLFGPDVGDRAFFDTPERDKAAFRLDREPGAVLDGDPVLAGLRKMLLFVVAGLLTVAGTLVMAIAWFGLRERQTWAMGSLTIAGLAVIPFWVLALLPYARAGVPLTPLHGPPFIGFTSALLVPALILGWIGVLRSE